jgi:hypothetical protein
MPGLLHVYFVKFEDCKNPHMKQDLVSRRILLGIYRSFFLDKIKDFLAR